MHEQQLFTKKHQSQLNNQTAKILFLSAAISVLISVSVILIFLGLQKNQEPSNKDLVKEFYLTENAVHVSPHHLRKAMTKGQTDDFILVDLRSPEEYKKEHIITAINIPAYKDPETSAYGDTERIIQEFWELDQNKEIIVYCYSMPCMTGRKIGKMLAENNIYVKHLGVGWNEWRYYWDLWNHDSEAPSQVEDYVISGAEPGIPEPKELPSSCGEGEFGC